MPSDTGHERLARLAALADAPDEQARQAARLLAAERNPEVVLAVLRLLGASPNEQLRPVLIGRYEHLDQHGARRDPGGVIRVAILGVLRPIATLADGPLFERAASTYEYRYGEVAGDLRAAGLLALSDIDGVLAGYHAVRLLADEHTSPMSGEPAVTAARVLAAQGQLLPLYAYATSETPRSAEVLAECLRSLTPLPPSLLPALVEHYRASQDEVVLLGLFDLLLAHAARDQYIDLLFDFLEETALLNLYRYLVTVLAGSHDARLTARLERLARHERDPRKQEILAEARQLWEREH